MVGLHLFGFGELYAEGVDGDGLHLLFLAGLVVHHVAGSACDAVNDFHTFGYAAERCVLTVQMGCVFVHDEELAACGVGSHGTCHGQNAAGVLQVVDEAVHLKFALDGVAGTAEAFAHGVAALNHEAGDDTVENDTVVEALVDQRDEVVDGVGSDFGVQLSLADAAVFPFDGFDGICHVVFLLSMVIIC